MKRMMLSILAAVLTVVLALPVSADKPGPDPVRNFYNVIMQDGADPWMYKHDGWYYFTVCA